jgi:hypothetical protein
MDKLRELEAELTDLFYNKIVSLNLPIAEAFDLYTNSDVASLAKIKVTTRQWEKLKYLAKRLKELAQVYKTTLQKSTDINEEDRQNMWDEVTNAIKWVEALISFVGLNCLEGRPAELLLQYGNINELCIVRKIKKPEKNGNILVSEVL